MQEQIPHLEAKEHWFVSLAKLWGWVIGLALVLGLLIWSGLGPIVRRLVMKAGLLIPKKEQEEVRMIRRDLKEGIPFSEARTRELQQRKADPAFRAAWDKAKRKGE